MNDITLEDEQRRTIRRVVSDPGVLDELLASIERDADFPCLRFVDPYGDTVFNRVQLEQVLTELQLLGRRATCSTERSALGEIAELARHAVDQPHLYMRLHGD